MENDIGIKKIYVDEKEVEIMPSKGTGYEYKKIECTNGITATFDKEEWAILFDDFSNATECNIYFKTSLSKKSYQNPPTGMFINIPLIMFIIILSVIIIKKVIRKKRFYKI